MAYKGAEPGRTDPLSPNSPLTLIDKIDNAGFSSRPSLAQDHAPNSPPNLSASTHFPETLHLSAALSRSHVRMASESSSWGLSRLVASAKRFALNTSPAPLTTLFPKTDPAVDGDECNHDCESCTVRYPSKFEINTEDELYGFVKKWETHLLVATGKTDWVRDVEDEKGSVMEAMGSATGPSNGVSCARKVQPAERQLTGGRN